MSGDEAPAQVDMEALGRELHEKSRMFMAIGRFIYQFSQLEFTMKAFLAAQIGIKEEHFDAVTASYDFHILSVVTQTISLMRFPSKRRASTTCLTDAENSTTTGIALHTEYGPGR